MDRGLEGAKKSTPPPADTTPCHEGSNCGPLGDCPWLVLSGPAGDYSFRVDLWTRNNTGERSNPWLLPADGSRP